MRISSNIENLNIPAGFLMDFPLVQLICMFQDLKLYLKYSFIMYTWIWIWLFTPRSWLSPKNWLTPKSWSTTWVGGSQKIKHSLSGIRSTIRTERCRIYWMKNGRLSELSHRGWTIFTFVRSEKKCEVILLGNVVRGWNYQI